MLDLAALADARRRRHLAVREPGGPTRRRFLQGAAVAGGVSASRLPPWLAEAGRRLGHPDRRRPTACSWS